MFKVTGKVRSLTANPNLLGENEANLSTCSSEPHTPPPPAPLSDGQQEECGGEATPTQQANQETGGAKPEKRPRPVGEGELAVAEVELQGAPEE